MSEIKIEKDIPIPKNRRKQKYPWHDMEVGDSFLIQRNTLSMGAVNDRYSPKKFIARKVENGVRIWRIE